MENQNQNQTLNKVEIIGEAKENKLKITPDVIRGSLVIQYGDGADDQVEVQVYCEPKTSKGKENKNYGFIKNLSENLVTKAKATEETPADVVSVYGYGDFQPSIRLNEYCNNGKIVSTPQVSLGFASMKITNLKKEDFKAEFEMDVYLTKKPIIDEATGYLKVQGLSVPFKGVVTPIDFIVKNEELIDGISECEANSTVSFWGDVKIARIKETKEKKSGFGGKAKTETKVTSTNELVITGGDFISEDDRRYIDPSFIKAAMGEREIYLDKLIKNEGQKASPKKQGGFGNNSPTNFTSPSQIKDSDLPF